MDRGAPAASVPRMETPTAMPASITAGTTLAYERTLSDLPATATSWKLSVFLAGPAEARQEGIVAVDGTYAVLFAAAITTDLPAGGYRWLERIVEEAPGARVYDVGSGVLLIEPDPATATGGSLLTHEAKILAALKAKQLDRLSADQETLQVEGTMLARIPFEELDRLIAKYQAIVDRQESPNATFGSVEIHFGRTT